MLAKNVHDKGYSRNTSFVLNYTVFIMLAKNVHDKGYFRNTLFAFDYTVFYYVG